jgi:chitodextrinase
MAFGATTQTTVALLWNASTDNVGVAGYSLFRNGTSIATVASPGYTYTGLTCGTTYTFAIEAYDAAGNASDGAQATGSTATAACSGSGDTQAPSAPAGLVASGQTQTAITLSWSASTDNVGVAGYGRYRDGTLVSSGSGTSFSFSGLACGTNYTLAVDGYDAAGNRSTRPSITAATTACSPGGSANVYLSVGGSDSNACTQAAPCKSFDRGYRVAAAGAVVEVAAGSYPAQTIATDGSKTSANDVVFRPASGASVVLADLTVLADHLEIRDLRVNNSASTKTSADDVTLRNIDMLGFFIEGSSNVSVLGGRVHCGVCGYHSQISAESGVNVAPTNLLIDGVLFEDWQAATSDQHTECLQIGGGNGIVIRNSTFRECATQTPANATSNIHVSWYGFGPKTSNVTIENNFIYQSGNAFSIQAGDYSGLRIRYNSIVGPIVIFGGQGDGTPVQITGNILRYTAGMCSAQPLGGGPNAPLTWRYNVLSGGTCHTTDKNAVYGFINQLTDLHLLAGATANGAGDPSSYPTTDIDGNTRSSTPDAGADER